MIEPLPNCSELAKIALKNYYETQSNSLSTVSNSDDEPFYKDISPRRTTFITVEDESEKEKYANDIFENFNRTSRSISHSSRKARECQQQL